MHYSFIADKNKSASLVLRNALFENIDRERKPSTRLCAQQNLELRLFYQVRSGAIEVDKVVHFRF